MKSVVQAVFIVQFVVHVLLTSISIKLIQSLCLASCSEGSAYSSYMYRFETDEGILVPSSILMFGSFYLKKKKKKLFGPTRTGRGCWS